MDMVDLEDKLSKSNARMKLIVTDGVFSMDGDIAPLQYILISLYTIFYCYKLSTITSGRYAAWLTDTMPLH